MLIAKSFLAFLFFSFCGWLWETVFCTVYSGNFENRGFLFGPVCPIYGVGVLASGALISYLEGLVGSFNLLQIFLLCAVGSFFLEYVTSWYLEQRFHARWWDYSHLPFNINGRVCVPASLVFGLIGCIALRIALPWFFGLVAHVSYPVLEFLALSFAALFGADFALTEAVLSELQMKVKEFDDEFCLRGERMYQAVAGAPLELKTKVSEVGAEALAAVGARGDQFVNLAEDSRRSVTSQMNKVVITLSYWQKDQLHRMRSVQPSSWVARLKTLISRDGEQARGGTSWSKDHKPENIERPHKPVCSERPRKPETSERPRV